MALIIKTENASSLLKAIKKAIDEVGRQMLRPIKDKLGDEYSYEEIRFVRALLIRGDGLKL